MDSSASKTSVTVGLLPPSGGAAPGLELQLRALGQTVVARLPGGPASDAPQSMDLTLPGPLRYARVRALCKAETGEGTQTQLCADFLWLPDDVDHGQLWLQAQQAGGIWTLTQASPGPALSLWAQAGLGSVVVLIVGLASLRRLARGR